MLEKLPILKKYLREKWLSTPVFGCVLIGGDSSRMGSAKHLLTKDGQTMLVRTIECLEQVVGSNVVICGAGKVPESLARFKRLPDVPDAQGPMSGVLAGMRWRPRASWLVAACDLPELSPAALEWLLSTRAPGIWASLPSLDGSQYVEPLLAHYDFRARPLLEQLAAQGNFRPGRIASHPKVRIFPVPPHLQAAWRNANSPRDLKNDAF
ncbi:MAG: molybdenum cofactor guanylyltransferase [Phycisphaerae bacterium]|nr:molybdenum cofactor guanylyltransferase [Phycisphaerae bacterium]